MHNLIHPSGLPHLLHPSLLALTQPTTPASFALDLEMYPMQYPDDVTSTLDPEPDMLRAFAAIMAVAEHTPGLEPLETLGQNLGLRQIRTVHDRVSWDGPVFDLGSGASVFLLGKIGGVAVVEFVAFSWFHQFLCLLLFLY